jgi:hypothetical protein
MGDSKGESFLRGWLEPVIGCDSRLFYFQNQQKVNGVRRNKPMMTNRRSATPLAAKQGLGSVVHAPPLLSAAVAYFCRWATGNRHFTSPCLPLHVEHPATSSIATEGMMKPIWFLAPSSYEPRFVAERPEHLAAREKRRQFICSDRRHGNCLAVL